jgi:hypothetical protein
VVASRVLRGSKSCRPSMRTTTRFLRPRYRLNPALTGRSRSSPTAARVAKSCRLSRTKTMRFPRPWQPLNPALTGCLRLSPIRLQRPAPRHSSLRSPAGWHPLLPPAPGATGRRRRQEREPWPRSIRKPTSVHDQRALPGRPHRAQIHRQIAFTLPTGKAASPVRRPIFLAILDSRLRPNKGVAPVSSALGSGHPCLPSRHCVGSAA